MVDRDVPLNTRSNRGSSIARRIRMAVGIVVGVMLAACSGHDAALELKLAHSAAPNSLIGRTADEFARLANERLGDRAKVVVFPASQLGSDETVLQKIRLGSVEIGANSSVMSSVADEFALFEMPYLVRDRDHMRRIEEAVFWPHVEPSAEAHGYRVLALWENGFRHITNSVRPIFTPADLAGLKIRTPGSPWRVRLFTALGASPSPLPYQDLFVALQTGMMDGQENPLSNIAGASLDEVQTYLTLSAHLYSPLFVVVSAQRFATWPEEVRKALITAARATQDFAYQAGAEEDERLLAELREAGMQVNEVDRASFEAASRPIYQAFAEQVPRAGAWIDTILALGDRGQ